MNSLPTTGADTGGNMNTIKDFECESCSNEPNDRINIRRFFAKLDELFSRNDLPAAGRLMDYWERDARALGDEQGLLEVLNEETGYFRRTGEKEKAERTVNEALALTDKLGLSETVSGATIYINCATTMKAFGDAKKALPYYEKARLVYEKKLEKGNFMLAALYNNTALALTDLGRASEAEEYFLLAIETLKTDGSHCGETAVSYVNLAQLYYRIGANEKIPAVLERGWEYLSSASIPHDGNFAFICSKCAPAYRDFGQTQRADILFDLAKEIYERN